MNTCKHCGFPFDMWSTPVCPKCQTDGDVEGFRQVLEIDVAHAGETWEQAREAIMRGLDQAIYERHKGLRVIHGYGSLTGAAVIAPRAISLMRHLAEQNDARFTRDQKNEGVSIIWLNRARTKEQSAEEPFLKAKSKDEPLGGNWFDQAMKKRP